MGRPKITEIAPIAGFVVGVLLIVWALAGLASAFDVEGVVGVLALVLGFVLVALTTTPLGRVAVKAVGIELEVERHDANQRTSRADT